MRLQNSGNHSPFEELLPHATIAMMESEGYFFQFSSISLKKMSPVTAQAKFPLEAKKVLMSYWELHMWHVKGFEDRGKISLKRQISCQDVLFPKGFGTKKIKALHLFRLLSLQTPNRRGEVEKQDFRKEVFKKEDCEPHLLMSPLDID